MINYVVAIFSCITNVVSGVEMTGIHEPFSGLGRILAPFCHNEVP